MSIYIPLIPYGSGLFFIKNIIVLLLFNRCKKIDIFKGYFQQKNWNSQMVFYSIDVYQYHWPQKKIHPKIPSTTLVLKHIYIIFHILWQVLFVENVFIVKFFNVDFLKIKNWLP